MKRRRRPPEYGGSGCDAVSAFFDDLRVPREAMLGAEGRGFKALARALDLGRVKMAALIVGLAQAACDAAAAWVTQREQFGRFRCEWPAPRYGGPASSRSLAISRSLLFWTLLPLADGVTGNASTRKIRAGTL